MVTIVWLDFIYIFLTPNTGEVTESEAVSFTRVVDERCWPEAVNLYESILKRQPDNLTAANALAKVAYENRDFDTALSLLSPFLKSSPENPVLLNNLAVVLAVKGKFELADDLLSLTAKLCGNRSEVFYNQACIALHKGNDQIALRILRRIVVTEPKNEHCLFALSRLCKEFGLVDESIGYCRKLAELFPENNKFKFNLGLVLLKNGFWEEGFELYEARWQASGLLPPAAEKLWRGESLSGKTILVRVEQGLGDTIQFARYLLLLRKCGARVVVSVQASLCGLLVGSFSGMEIIISGEDDSIVYDYHVSLLSLPYLFQSRFDNLPVQTSYLKVSPASRGKWQQKLAGNEDALKVGVVWGSNPINTKEKRRAISIEIFARLFTVSGVRFFSLKKERNTKDVDFLRNLPVSVSERYVDFTDEIDDFQDTAAIMENLDLVISCDTSVPHLAGALARPTWLLLPFDADWRWLLEREDSPWYPTMRLFRQPEPGNWDSVLDLVRNELEELVCEQNQC